MKLNQLRRIIKEEILREIKVNKIGNLIIDPQIQKDIDNNSNSDLQANYEDALPGLKDMYEIIRDSQSSISGQPISFEIGIIRDYPWLAKIYTGLYGADNYTYDSEDELVLVAKQGPKEFAVQVDDRYFADANTEEGKKVIAVAGADVDAFDDNILDAFVEWSKLP